MRRFALPFLLVVFVAVPLLVTACGKDRRVTMLDASPERTVEECTALYDRAQVEAADAFDRARKDCQTDDDCVLASRRGCLSDCGGYSIAKSALPEWQKAREQLAATTCKRYADGDCYAKVPVAVPTCAVYRPACVGGHCIAR